MDLLQVLLFLTSMFYTHVPRDSGILFWTIELSSPNQSDIVFSDTTTKAMIGGVGDSFIGKVEGHYEKNSEET